MSLLHSLPSIVSKPKKRLGRGHGSGKGAHTVGRGSKGQGARVGSKQPHWFEGGQLPLVKRLPMLRGKSRVEVLTPCAEVTLGDLNRTQADVVTIDTLKLEGIVHRNYPKVKVIANGTLTKAVTLQGIKVSAAAKKAIEKAGGTVQQ